MAWAPAFIDNGTTGANSSTHTYSGITFPTGKIAVGVFENCQLGQSIASVTVNGVSATRMAHCSTIANHDLDFWEADVTAGTGSIVVQSTSGNFTRGGMGCWDVTDGEYINAAILTDPTDNPVDLSMNTVAGDAFMMVACSQNVATSWSPTGFTENFDSVVEVRAFCGGINANCTGASPETFTALNSPSHDENSALGVLYREVVSGSVGTSAGVGAASAVGRKIQQTVGTSAGVGAASAVGRKILARVGTSAGVGAASAVGRKVQQTVGVSDGLASADGVAEIIIEAVGTSDGVASVSGVTPGAPSTTDTVGASDGVASVNGVTETIIESVATSDGAASVDGVAEIITEAVGASDGASTVGGISQIVIEAVGAADGLADVVGVSSEDSAVGTSDGVATANGVSQIVIEAVGTSDGVATADADGQIIIEAIGTADGTSTALASRFVYWRARAGQSRTGMRFDTSLRTMRVPSSLNRIRLD